MKILTLTQGYEAVVDDEDYEWLSQWKWSVVIKQNSSNRYAQRYEKGRCILLHRFIMSAPRGFEVDHKDGDGLNNQRDNLRVCTHIKNLQNQKKRSNTTSIHKGVHANNVSARSPWTASIGEHGRTIYLGVFSNERDAALAYNTAAKELFGEFAKLNNV